MKPTNKDIYQVQRVIRQQFTRSEYYKYVLSTYISKTVGKRGGKLYNCSICKSHTSPKDYELHHDPEVIRIGEHYSDVSLDDFISRLWVSEDKLVGICKSCHQSITNEQKKERKNGKI